MNIILGIVIPLTLYCNVSLVQYVRAHVRTHWVYAHICNYINTVRTHTQGIMSYIDSTGCHLHPTLPLNGNSVLARIPWDYCHPRLDTLRRGILLTDPGDAWPFRYVGLADMLYPLNHRLTAHSLAVFTLFLVFLHCLMISSRHVHVLQSLCDIVFVFILYFVYDSHSAVLVLYLYLACACAIIVRGPVQLWLTQMLALHTLQLLSLQSTLCGLYAHAPPLSSGHARRELDWTDFLLWV